MDDKIHLIFTVYDSDGDGLVSPDDMELMLRQLAGSTLRSVCFHIALLIRKHHTQILLLLCDADCTLEAKPSSKFTAENALCCVSPGD